MLSGTVIVDSTFFHPQYFLDVDGDDSADYRLMFGPWWYKPETSATLPGDGDSVTIVGQENSRMMGQHLVTTVIVFEINGETWRDPIQVGMHGWRDDHLWETGGDTITVTGTIFVDSTYFYPVYFIDTDGDSIADYKLGLGPMWHEPAAGPGRPKDGDIVTIFGRKHTSMFGIDMLVVYQIDGVEWRPQVGPPSWAGAWMQREHQDSMYVYCVNDSSNWMVFGPGHMGHGGMGMGGMRWPDSVFVQFWQIYPDSLPGEHNPGHFMGFYVNIHDPEGNSVMGGSMWGGQNWGGHHGRTEFENDHRIVFHYRDQDMMRNHLNESTMQIHYWDPVAGQWMPEPNALIDAGNNMITISSNTLNTYYALFAQPETTGVSEAADIPKQFELLGNYPNPFNPETTIAFRISQRGPVRLEIYNIAGQRLATLLNEIREPGLHRVAWNGKDANRNGLASGIYLLTLDLGGKKTSKRMTLIK
jgi:hypothetical protein